MTLMPRPCLICSDNRKLARAEELITAGNSDQVVANALNALTPDLPPMSSMAVSRHRRKHIMKATQDRLAIVGKGPAPRKERQQLAAAAAAGAPTPQEFVDAFFGLKAQAEKLQRIEERLERMAELAEQNNSPSGVATVAAQQLRSVETGAKLGGTGGYGAQKATGAEGVQFNLVMHFGDHTERLTMTPLSPPSAQADAPRSSLHLPTFVECEDAIDALLDASDDDV